MGYYFGKGTAGGEKGGTVSLRDAIARVTGDVNAPLGAGTGTGNRTLIDRDPEEMDDYGKRYDGTGSGKGARRRPGTGTVVRKNPEPVPDALGEWQWPDEMKDLYSMLWGRAGDLLNKEGGFSQEVLDQMFGKNFENVRGQEAGAREGLLQDLAAQGMLGTGTETEAMKDLAWGTEKNVGDIQRDVFLANEAQKRQDIQSFTQLANELFNSMAGYNTTEEALNATRRNESNNMLAMLLQYYLASQGSQGG